MNAVFPIFWLVILVISILSKGAASKKGSSGSVAKAPAPRTQGSDRTLRRQTKEDDCDYGEINHKFSHESEGRIKQLDGYLQAGLIDKKEYAQMLERYKKAERDFERYE